MKARKDKEPGVGCGPNKTESTATILLAGLECMEIRGGWGSTRPPGIESLATVTRESLWRTRGIEPDNDSI